MLDLELNREPDSEAQTIILPEPTALELELQRERSDPQDHNYVQLEEISNITTYILQHSEH